MKISNQKLEKLISLKRRADHFNFLIDELYKEFTATTKEDEYSFDFFYNESETVREFLGKINIKIKND